MHFVESLAVIKSKPSTSNSIKKLQGNLLVEFNSLFCIYRFSLGQGQSHK